MPETAQEALENVTPQIQLLINRNYFELFNENLLPSHTINCFCTFIVYVNIRGQILPYVSTKVSRSNIMESSVLSQERN